MRRQSRSDSHRPLAAPPRHATEMHTAPLSMFLQVRCIFERMAYALKMYREFPSTNFTPVKLCCHIWRCTLPFPRDSHAVSRPRRQCGLHIKLRSREVITRDRNGLPRCVVESLRAGREFCHLLWQALAKFKRLARITP
jgi:hypothetical protein